MVTSKQVAAIKMKAGTFKHSKYFRKRDARFVDRYTRNISRTPTARPIGRDVIQHRAARPARATREYKVGR